MSDPIMVTFTAVRDHVRFAIALDHWPSLFLAMLLLADELDRQAERMDLLHPGSEEESRQVRFDAEGVRHNAWSVYDRKQDGASIAA